MSRGLWEAGLPGELRVRPLEEDQRLARLLHCTVSRQMQTFKMAFISKSNFVKS